MEERRQISDLRIGDVFVFVEVTRAGSVTSAARQLGVTPSQVSKAISRLEDVLQSQLFVRSARGVLLTEDGRKIGPALEQMADQVNRLQETRSDSPLISLVAPSAELGAFLPLISEHFTEHRFRGFEMPKELIWLYATQGAYELAITEDATRLPKNWTAAELGSYRRATFAPPDVARALMTRTPIPPERLKEFPFVVPAFFSKGEWIAVDDECPMSRTERTPGHQTNSIWSALDVAARTGQLVFGPALAARRHVERGELVELPVAGWSVQTPLYLACDSDRILNSTFKRLSSFLSEAMK